MNPSSVRLTDDTGWRQGAPDPTVTNPVLTARVLAAFSHSSTTPTQENTAKALKTLSNFGLVVEDLEGRDTNLSAAPLAQYILCTLLDIHPLGGSSDPSVFPSAPGSSFFKTPLRSNMMLHQISLSLSVEIIVFSSRAKPITFRPPSPVSTVAFFHNIDSYLNISEFLVLVPSTYTLIPRIGMEIDPQKRPPSKVKAAEWRPTRRTSTSTKEGTEKLDLPPDEYERQLRRSWYVNQIPIMYQSLFPMMFGPL